MKTARWLTCLFLVLPLFSCDGDDHVTTSVDDGGGDEDVADENDDDDDDSLPPGDDDDNDDDNDDDDDDDDDTTVTETWADYRTVFCGQTEQVTPADAYAFTDELPREMVAGGPADVMEVPAAAWNQDGRGTVWGTKGGFLVRYEVWPEGPRVSAFGYPAARPEAAAGADGKAHVVYVDPQKRVLYHLEESIMGWQRTPVACDAQFESADVAVGADGEPQIAYGVVRTTRGHTRHYLYHTVRWEGDWRRREIDTDADEFAWVRLAVADDGQVGIVTPCWYDGLFFARSPGQDWSRYVAFPGYFYEPNPHVSDSKYCLSMDLAFDSRNRAHIVGTTTHESWSSPPPAGWTTNTTEYFRPGLGLDHETVQVTGGLGSDLVSMAIAGDDTVHVVVRHGLALRDYRREASGWQSDTAVFPGGTLPQMAIDSADRVLVAQYTTLGGALQYTMTEANGWRTAVLDEANTVGGSATVATDADGAPVVLYELTKPAAFRAARRPGVAWESVDAVAVADTRLPAGATALDGAGKLHALYYDPDGDAVRYAAETAGAWESEPVYQGQSDFALAVDGAGRPYAVYCDASDQGLRLAVRNAKGWTAEHPAPELNGCAFPHVAVTAAGAALVAFNAVGPDQQTGLYLASNETGAWEVTPLVVPLDGRSWGMDIELGTDGEPRVAAAADGALLILVRAAGVWSDKAVTSIPPYADRVADVSLLVDADNHLDVLAGVRIEDSGSGFLCHFNNRYGDWSGRIVAVTYGGDSGLAAGPGGDLYAAYTQGNAVMLATIPAGY